MYLLNCSTEIAMSSTKDQNLCNQTKTQQIFITYFRSSIHLVILRFRSRDLIQINLRISKGWNKWKARFRVKMQMEISFNISSVTVEVRQISRDKYLQISIRYLFSVNKRFYVSGADQFSKLKHDNQQRQKISFWMMDRHSN